MISVGGADPLHLAYGFAKRISEDEFFKDKNINMILGKMEPDIDKIESICETAGNIRYFVNIKDMKEKIDILKKDYIKNILFLLIIFILKI